MRSLADCIRGFLSSPKLKPSSRPAKSVLAGLPSPKTTALPLAVLLLLALTACNSAASSATPTMGVDAIYTAAFQTFTAQQATELASTPPTPTPSPSPFPTLGLPISSTILPFGTATSAAGGAVGCDSSVFVKDITIPDGTSMTPGETFVKTWAMLNNGTCRWTTSYQLTFASGDAMGGNAVAIASPVAASQQTELSVHLTAPATSGSYTGWWRMQNDKGQYFGNGFSVVITVSGSATNTPAAATDTPAPTNTPTDTPTATP